MIHSGPTWEKKTGCGKPITKTDTVTMLVNDITCPKCLERFEQEIKEHNLTWTEKWKLPAIGGRLDNAKQSSGCARRSEQ